MVSSSYFVYVVPNRDASSASFVMMQSLLFSALLVAKSFRTLPWPGRWEGAPRQHAIAACAAYVALTSFVTYRSPSREMMPVVLNTDAAAAERMFRH